jgi:hypothetical protein
MTRPLNRWQDGIHSNLFVSRRLRTEASQLAARHLTGGALRDARLFLTRTGRTAAEVHQFMNRLTARTTTPGQDTRPS